ncbi:hypothetical protein ACHAAC_08715 [Aeromicrobium sp. CF4.19]|uniref:hypothetical protein n=1 Tax=Aeromicrobium sp. CF4.19 TaxID=3373082 RepID=UPI003EE57339
MDDNRGTSPGRVRPTTLLVEPSPSGHRFQTVAMVAEVLARTDDVVVLTSAGAVEDPAHETFLAHLEGVRVEGALDEEYPPTRTIVREVARRSAVGEADTVVVLDADQALKRWWWEAPRAFGLRRRPRIVFMLTRYPARLDLTDVVGWRLRIPKATLAVLAMLSGSLRRVAGFAGRDDLSRGWIVKRTRDPARCGAHSRDRATLRERHGLPVDRRLVGIFGGVSERKHPDLVWDALVTSGLEADLVLGGGLSESVTAWIDSIRQSDRNRIVLRPGFLPDQDLDELVAAADAVALVMTNNGPSGIMGKALAAGVPVVTAGSTVRASEVAATGGGESAAMTAESIGTALDRVLERGGLAPSRVPEATVEAYVAAMIGRDGRNVG